MRHDTHDIWHRVTERGCCSRHSDLRGTSAASMSGSLFDEPGSNARRGAPSRAPSEGTPLAERIRPRTLDEIVGQEEILGPGTPLREAIERDLLQSIILWGPPGTGKTTL